MSTEYIAEMCGITVQSIKHCKVMSTNNKLRTKVII